MKNLVGLFVLLALGAFVLGVAVTVMLQTATVRVGSVATLRVVGVSVWTDADLTIPLTSIDWGLIGPGENTTFAFYIRNEGTTQSSLSMWTEAWQPTNASNWVSLSWNLEGATLEVGEAKQAVLVLSVSPSIEGITRFSFDIVIAGSE